ncbi:hypothetical protein AB0I64_38510, partial [Nonomuraea sp. NPDC050405]
MATEHSGAQHLPPSWPEVPPREGSSRGDSRQSPSARRAQSSERPAQHSWQEAASPSHTSWPDVTVASGAPNASNASNALNASWPETPRQDGPAGRHDGMRDGMRDGGRGGSREPVHRDPVPAWQDPSSSPSSPSNAWSNLSSPAPWPPADSAPVRPSSADAMERTMTYGAGTPLNDHAMPQGPHTARLDDRSHERPQPVPQGSYGDGMPLDERAASQGRERTRPGGDRPGPG